MYRCPHCRSRRATWHSLTKHKRKTGHRACDCGGHGHYHFAHRPGSPYCVHNLMGDVNAAISAGTDLTDEEYDDIKAERQKERQT